MSLNNTPSAERLHIGIFGKRNAGKSSVINALTGQNLAIVSDIKGTTTDPVLKSMELLPLGPVVIIDTPGLDDDADVLGALRIQKAYQMLNKTDIAILVIDGTVGMTEEDKKILTHIQDKKIPYIVVLNKADLAVSNVCPGNQSDSDVCKPLDSMTTQIARSCQIAKEHILWVSAQDHSNIQELKELIGKLIPSSDNDRYIVRDLIRPMDLIVLVVPIDSAAPKGRLILPQQQTIRDILESGAVSIVVRETELADTLKKEEPVALKHFLSHPFILRANGSGTRKEIDLFLERHQINLSDLNIVARMNDLESIKKSIVSGLGVSILSARSVKDMERTHQLLTFPLESAAQVRTFYIVYSKNRILKPYVKQFLKFVEHYYK